LHSSHPVGESIVRAMLEFEQAKRRRRGHAAGQRNGPVPELANVASS
jgi:hypothetical protein